MCYSTYGLPLDCQGPDGPRPGSSDSLGSITLYVLLNPRPALAVTMPGSTTVRFAAKRVAEAVGADPSPMDSIVAAFRDQSVHLASQDIGRS